MANEQFPKKITSLFNFPFSVAQDGLYSIALSARCARGNDLRIEIDGLKLREIPSLAKPQYYNIPAAWNGARLKGLKQIVIFILKISRGEHKLTFIPEGEAVIESEPQIVFTVDSSQISFDLNEQAEDGDRRPWLTLALIDLPLQEIAADVTATWRLGDSDDVKLIIDNTVQENSGSIFHHNWLWSGSIFKKLLQKERQTKSIKTSLSQDFHYIEFWADRTPILHRGIFDLGKDELSPTVTYPRWTGDFADDTEKILLARALFGEARDIRLSDAARAGVAWTIRNRVEDARNRWGRNYYDVLLKSQQYSAFNTGDKNRPFVEDPFQSKSEIDKLAWYKCCEIAGLVINAYTPDPTGGSNHYYDDSIEAPSWATPQSFQIKVGPFFFHRL